MCLCVSVTLGGLAASQDVPKAKKNLEGSGASQVNDRDSGVALLGEMLMLCNEAARRFRHDAAPGTGSKPLALEYLADRMDTDDPLHGWVVRTRKEGWMQGFCTITNFTTWVRWFRWDSLAPQAGVIRTEDDSGSEDEEEAQWLAPRIIDSDGSLSAALNEQVHDGDPDGEGVIWPHLAEISLLGALGCGAWLLRLIIEELEKPDSQYDYCVCQATDNAVPFYESLGFVRVGAVARYDYAPKACGDGAEAQENLRRQADSRKMLKIWDAIATARDEETGELHSTLFMSLPSKKLYPDYYELIKRPVALNPIRKKIEALKYESMVEFEMDLKQLIDNARLYNSSDSLVYTDAERLQRVAFAKMGKQYFGKEPGAEDYLWMQFKVGFQLDVKDSRGHWYKANIVETGVDRIKVHYLGWNQKWNEWHEKGNDDVQPLGTHTGGTNTTKRKTTSTGMPYKVLRAADVREDFPLSSKICNALKAGETVTVVEKRSNDRGQVRVRIEKPCSGWTSVTSRDGATLLAPADPNSSTDNFVNDTAGSNPADKSGWVDPENQGHVGVSSKTFWYQVKDGQTPREIASKNRCQAWDIVWLNKHLYPGLDASSKMKGGTKLRVPVVKSAADTKKAAEAAAAKASADDARPSVYEALNDETPKLIANKLGIDVVDLVSVNRSRYEGMTQTSRLMAGTKLKIPREKADDDDDDDDWAGGAGVVSYRHWTFPNDPVELTYPSYMMARKLNKRTVEAPPGSILAELDKYVHDPPPLAGADDDSDDDAAEMDLTALDAALTKEDAKRGMMQVWNAVVNCTDEEDELAQHRVRSAFFRELPSRSMFPDYYKLIKEPLSLNRVRSRINGGKYDTPAAFMTDLATVFSNARQYNDPLAQIYYDAQIMECVADEEIQSWQDDWRDKQAQAHYEAQLPPKPKRASSSYLCYANSERDTVASELAADSNGLTAVARELGARWNVMSRRERRKYEDEAERDARRYERELREYNRQVQKIPKPPPKPRRKKKQRPPRPVAGAPVASPRGARSSPLAGRPGNQGPTNFFNKVVTVKGESLVGDYDYFFVLTYIPDLQWCRLAPLVQDGVFGRDRGARKGWPRWVLAKDEGSEMDVSASRCKVCRTKAVNRSADADAEEWEIREGEAERVLGMKREKNGRKAKTKSSGRASKRGKFHAGTLIR